MKKNELLKAIEKLNSNEVIEIKGHATEEYNEYKNATYLHTPIYTLTKNMELKLLRYETTLLREGF